MSPKQPNGQTSDSGAYQQIWTGEGMGMVGHAYGFPRDKLLLQFRKALRIQNPTDPQG